MNDIEKLIDNLLFILGVTLPIVMKSNDKQKDWIIKAVESVIYKNEGLPPLWD